MTVFPFGSSPKPSCASALRTSESDVAGRETKPRLSLQRCWCSRRCSRCPVYEVLRSTARQRSRRSHKAGGPPELWTWWYDSSLARGSCNKDHLPDRRSSGIKSDIGYVLCVLVVTNSLCSPGYCVMQCVGWVIKVWICNVDSQRLVSSAAIMLSEAPNVHRRSDSGAHLEPNLLSDTQGLRPEDDARRLGPAAVCCNLLEGGCLRPDC